MSQPIVKSLIDDQIAQIERSLAIIGAGLPRELPVANLTPNLVASIKAGRISVRPRQ